MELNLVGFIKKSYVMTATASQYLNEKSELKWEDAKASQIQSKMSLFLKKKKQWWQLVTERV